MQYQLKSVFVQLILLIFCSVTAFATMDSVSIFQADPKENIFTIGFDKNVNIYNYFSDFSNRISIFKTDVLIANKFRSTAINTNDLNYKDENVFKLELNRNLFSKLSFGLDNYFLYNLDSRPIGNNKLFEISSIPNFKYIFPDESSLQLGVGPEYNEKIGIKSQGTALLIKGFLNSYKIDEIGIKSEFYLKSTKYNDDRTNRTLNSQTVFTANYSQNNNIELGVNYNNNIRDFINFLDISQKQYLFEQNGDQNLDAIFKISYNPFPIFQIYSQLEYSSQSKKREFNNSSDLLAASLFSRKSQISKIQLSNTALINFENLKNTISVDYETTEESFNSFPKSNEVLPSIATAYQNTQKLNDYNSTRLKINSNHLLTIGRADSLILNLAASIYQYDTPSKENNDEHDESYSSLFAKYVHRFNKRFLIKLSAELKNQHYVYLKAEKSGQSNDEKSIRFKPEMIYYTNYFYCNPQFEVLSNYHIYDFQSKMNSVSTFSFRQLSYQDSLSLRLNENIYLSSNILLRYSERGMLYWDNFSETPIKGNMEQMYKLMIYNKFDNFTFGIGGGLYKYEQNDLQGSTASYSSIILSPEAVIGIIFSIKGKLYLNCKYDFQNIGGVHREVSNISLNTELKF